MGDIPEGDGLCLESGQTGLPCLLDLRLVLKQELQSGYAGGRVPEWLKLYYCSSQEYSVHARQHVQQLITTEPAWPRCWPCVLLRVPQTSS